MSAKSQYQFHGREFQKPGDRFGGSLLKGNPKTKRPLASRLPIHVVLRSQKSILRLPKTFARVDQITIATARKHGVRIYKAANVGNHLHLLIKLRSVRGWAAFIRELTGRLAQEVAPLIHDENRVANTAGTGIQKKRNFWLYRPFTRIVRGWRRAFLTARMYLELNRLEAEGFISRKETKTLKELRLIWAEG